MINPNELKVLIVCEESQTTTIEFRKLGFQAYSNDIKDCSGGFPQYHLKMDCFEAIERIKPTLLIGHPPCTFLSYVANNNWTDTIRTSKRIEAAKFFMDLYNTNVKYICLENPLGIMSKLFRKSDQEIHPYYFGEMQVKRTCLWLRNLPLLHYSLNNTLFDVKTSCEKPNPVHSWINKKGKQKREYYINVYNTDEAYRSKSFKAISEAMAKQWGYYICQQP